VIVVARANRPPADQWETLVSSSIPLASHAISAVQRHSAENQRAQRGERKH